MNLLLKDKAFYGLCGVVAIATSLATLGTGATATESVNSSESPAFFGAMGAEAATKEAERILHQGRDRFREGRYREAIERYQQARELYRERDDRAGEAAALQGMGAAYRHLAAYDSAREVLEEAIALANATNEPSLGMQEVLGRTLNELGAVFSNRGDYPRALELYAEALQRAEAMGDRWLQGRILDNEGVAFRRQGDYPRARERHERALDLARATGDRWNESWVLGNLGAVYAKTGNYAAAIATDEEALAIARETGNRFAEGRILNGLGLTYDRLGRYDEAVAFYQQALEIQVALGDRIGEGRTLSNLGIAYHAWGAYDIALSHHEQALALRREIGDRAGEAISLGNLGLTYESLGRYDKALERYEEALLLSRNLGDREGEGYALASLAGVKATLGRYSEALEFFAGSLAVRQEIGDRAGEAYTLNSLGGIYFELGQIDRAQTHYQQALALWETLGNDAARASTLQNLGAIASYRNDAATALARYEEALVLRRSTGDRVGEGKTLQAIGVLLPFLDRAAETPAVLEEALAIQRQIGNRADEAEVLNALGWAHQIAGDSDRALTAYQMASVLFRDLGYLAGERRALANLAGLLAEREETVLAIALYKRSVEISETIRQDLRVLERAERDTYARTVADTYRALADLLLQGDRVLEAQQVLDLLKLQELDDYLQDVRGRSESATGIDYLPAERELLEDYDRLQESTLAFVRELTELERSPGALTPAQQQRLVELDTRRRQLVREFVAFTRNPEIVALTQQLQQTSDRQTLGLDRLRNFADNLRHLDETAVLLYPLILEDRLEIVLASPDAPPVRRTVAVSRDRLNQTILEYRRALTHNLLRRDRSHALEPAQQLYDWLVRPFEAELADIQPTTLVYAPDGQLRYIPLAAFHDGDRWLVERFRTNNITAASLTDFNRPSATGLRVLAGALVEGNHRIEVGDRSFTLAGLPYAGREVERLAATIPETTALFDRDFSKTAILPQLNRHSILHFATHAAFLPGTPEESFILFGDGSRTTLREVQDEWFLTDVDLIVLSACQTGVGGRLGTGEEVLGFGYLMQNAGARAAIASLWMVNDRSTQVLMNTFYDRLREPDVNKAAALQEAQIALIRSGEAAIDGRKTDGEDYSHPFHWSGFVLIGNGW